MKRTILLAISALFAASVLSGCAAAYTNVEPVGENTYRLTEIRSGAFRLKGVVLECKGSGTTLTCKEIVVQ